jgi:hypothetical protein
MSNSPSRQFSQNMQVAPGDKKKPAVTALPPPRKQRRRVRAARLLSPDENRAGSSLSSRGTSLPSAPSKPLCRPEMPRQAFAAHRLGRDFRILGVT